jgi:hypothetical protein
MYFPKNTSSLINNNIFTTINTVKNKFFTESKKPLGRWNIDYCNIKLDKKVILSNEDHCGPCGQYILEKKINKF